MTFGCVLPDDARGLPPGLSLGVQIPGHSFLLHRAHERNPVHVPVGKQSKTTQTTVTPFKQCVIKEGCLSVNNMVGFGGGMAHMVKLVMKALLGI